MVISSHCVNMAKGLASPKQTTLYCTKALATPEQTATGKEISNPLTADSLLKTIKLSMHLINPSRAAKDLNYHWLGDNSQNAPNLNTSLKKLEVNKKFKF
ncbi:hypothetical protein Tco_0841848 [Tanacetum coccineum]|uniref:Uncharacterized protein n=1 Tax=Tanacetum coccineum TaxID=301880 RepID=A0ABQ5AXK0_9ASTR